MAEERNVGVARASETAVTELRTARSSETMEEEDATKEELQRRMEEARESITQTVAEIKDTVTNQYQHVRETISESLDWREQYRRRPAAFSIGAMGVGLLLGYGIGSALSNRRDYYDEEMDYDTERVSTGPIMPQTARSYASQAIVGGAYGSSAHAPNYAASTDSYTAMESQPATAPDSRPSYSSGYEPATAEEPEKPGLMARFKETKAYDRLQQELNTLGDRVIDELSTTARNVVLPALLGKLKDVIGIDLSMQREVAQRSQLENQTSSARAGANTGSSGSSGASNQSQQTQRAGANTI